MLAGEYDALECILVVLGAQAPEIAGTLAWTCDAPAGSGGGITFRSATRPRLRGEQELGLPGHPVAGR